jgi:hypothetical protein
VADDLEAPAGLPDGWVSALYRARGADVSSHRPVFTGDVFRAVPCLHSDGTTTEGVVIMLQHPCALRSNGVDLVHRLLVAELRQFNPLEPDEWKGNYTRMPLPDAFTDVASNQRHQAADFRRPQLIGRDEFCLGRRIVCMTEAGVNLLMQRWAHHNTRVVVKTDRFVKVTSGPYEEADLTEGWCEEAAKHGVSSNAATAAFLDWLREAVPDGLTRQDRLDVPQMKSQVRRESDAALEQFIAEHTTKDTD